MTDKKDNDNKKKSSEPLPDPFCDWNGACGRKAFAEVYPLDSKATYMEGCPVFKEKGWSYLCFRHFVYATIRGDSLVWCEVSLENTTRSQRVIVEALGIIVKFYGGIRKIKYFFELANKLNNVDTTNKISGRIDKMVIKK